jgi:hypothetical protein
MIVFSAIREHPVLATPWVPVDAMECGHENALLLHDLAQMPPADMQGKRSAELHNDCGW